MKQLLLATSLALALAACATPGTPGANTSNADATSRIVAAQKQEAQIIAYFADSPEGGVYAEGPSEGGYFRKLLGRTKEGYYVVQDFYQDSGRKQSDPLIVTHEAALKSFSNDYSDGWVVLYDTEGRLAEQTQYRQGQPNGWAIAYQNGYRVSQGRYQNGKPHGEWTFWGDEGRRKEAIIGYQDGRQVSWKGWTLDETATPLTEEEVKAKYMQP